MSHLFFHSQFCLEHEKCHSLFLYIGLLTIRAWCYSNNYFSILSVVIWNAYVKWLCNWKITCFFFPVSEKMLRPWLPISYDSWLESCVSKEIIRITLLDCFWSVIVLSKIRFYRFESRHSVDSIMKGKWCFGTKILGFFFFGFFFF